MKLEQKRGGYKRSFELKDSMLKTTYNNILSSSEWSIDIEHIGHEKEIKSYSRVGVHAVGYFFAIIALTAVLGIIFDNTLDDDDSITIAVGAIFMAVLAITCFKVPMDNTLKLKGGTKDLIFFLEHPSRKEVEKFADELVRISKSVILEKYSRVDPDIPEEDFFRQMNWLLQNNYLTEKEYEEKKKEYKINRLC